MCSRDPSTISESCFENFSTILVCYLLSKDLSVRLTDSRKLTKTKSDFVVGSGESNFSKPNYLLTIKKCQLLKCFS